MKKYLNHIVVLSMLTTASAVAITGCASSTATSSAAGALPTVKLMTLNSAAAAGVSGKVSPSQTARIYSKLSGRITAVNVKEGNKVKKGDVLVQLSTVDLEQQVLSAEAALEQAQAALNDAVNGARPQEVQQVVAALAQAKANLESANASLDSAKSSYDLVTKTYNQTKNLYDEGSATKSDMDNVTMNYEKAKAGYEQAAAAQSVAQASVAAAQAKLDLTKAGATSNSIDSLRAKVDQAQAALQIAKNAVEDAAIKAPFDGTIVKKLTEVGEMAFSSMPSSTELLVMVNTETVDIDVSVPEDLISKVKEGAQVKLTVPSIPGKTFDGTVRFVSPVSDTNNNTFPVKVSVPNPDGVLRAGAIANVSFDGGAQSALELPKTAILKKDGSSAVYKVDGDVVHKVTVQTEDKNQDWVYVKGDSALKASDKIVINPTDSLAEGAKVKAE